MAAEDQGNIFPITIIMKKGELQVISTVMPTKMRLLLERIIEELNVPMQGRPQEQEAAEEVDGGKNTLFQMIEGIQADAMCFLSDQNEFLFVLIEEASASDAEKLRHQMREKLMKYIH